MGQIEGHGRFLCVFGPIQSRFIKYRKNKVDLEQIIKIIYQNIKREYWVRTHEDA